MADEEFLKQSPSEVELAKVLHRIMSLFRSDAVAFVSRVKG